MLRPRSLFASAAVAALLLAGCGGDDGGDADDATTTTEAPEEATTTEAPATTEADEDEGDDEEGDGDGDTSGADAEVTEAGATLGLGEQAVVEYENEDEVTQLGVSIDEITAGTLDELEAAGLEIDERFDGLVPFFVRSTIENLGDLELSGVSVNANIDGVTDDGDRAQTLILIGYADCRSESFRGEGTGETIESCKVVLAPEGSDVTTAEYSSSLLDDAIVWE